MRILLLTHRLPYSPNRGDRIRAYHIIHTLKEVAAVDVVSMVHDDEEAAQADSMKGCAESVTIARVPRLRNLGRGAVALAGTRPLTHVLLDSPGFRNAIAGVTATRPPDVVLAYCSGTARFALEPMLSPFPFVLDMVDVDSAKWSALSRSSRWPKAWIYAREARHLADFEARAVRRARMTIAVNEREREELHRLVPNARVAVVGNGIDLTAFRPRGVTNRQPHVVFCGVMNYQPNSDAALRLGRRIWPRVTVRRPDARLLIVGSNPTRAVQDLRSDPTITVTGTVPDVRPYLWNAQVAVAPLATARGIQNKVLEALAAGLPPIVSPAVFEGLPAHVRSGCTPGAGDEAIANYIIELLSREQDGRDRQVANADLGSLSWSEQLEPLVDILRKAAETKQKPFAVSA
jgi:polysaccharide biosynthesis protein PslH